MTALSMTVSDTLVLAKRNLSRIPRQPDLLIAYTIQPVMCCSPADSAPEGPPAQAAARQAAMTTRAPTASYVARARTSRVARSAPCSTAASATSAS